MTVRSSSPLWQSSPPSTRNRPPVGRTPIFCVSLRRSLSHARPRSRTPRTSRAVPVLTTLNEQNHRTVPTRTRRVNFTREGTGARDKLIEADRLSERGARRSLSVGESVPACDGRDDPLQCAAASCSSVLLCGGSCPIGEGQKRVHLRVLMRKVQESLRSKRERILTKTRPAGRGT